MDKEWCQGEIELDSLEKSPKGIKNNSAAE